MVKFKVGDRVITVQDGNVTPLFANRKATVTWVSATGSVEPNVSFMFDNDQNIYATESPNTQLKHLKLKQLLLW